MRSTDELQQQKRVKTNSDDVRALREEFAAAGYTFKDVPSFAARHNMRLGTMSALLRGYTFGDVGGPLLARQKPKFSDETLTQVKALIRANTKRSEIETMFGMSSAYVRAFIKGHERKTRYKMETNNGEAREIACGDSLGKEIQATQISN